MIALNKSTEEYEMRINIKKTKVMGISKNGAKQLNIRIDGNILELSNSVTLAA